MEDGEETGRTERGKVAPVDLLPYRFGPLIRPALQHPLTARCPGPRLGLWDERQRDNVRHIPSVQMSR